VDRDKIHALLEKVRAGSMDIETAMAAFRTLPYEDLGFAMVDSHRALRKGFPEVIFCQNKTREQVVGIIDSLSQDHKTILATRADVEMFEAVNKKYPEAKYHRQGRIIQIGETPKARTKKSILVITAGTSDITVAEEAVVTAEAMGNIVEKIYDAGVAGIHRLFGRVEKIIGANVIVVVAGMDGALPSIIGGLVDRPVIAVPTSVGYGASFNGLSALLTMLNSCAPGVSVVNIDNGFGAGYIAAMINLAGE